MSDVSAAELELVRRCLRGDVVAVRALVERYQGEVFGVCYRLMNHRQDAEDVAQEVFVRVVRHLARWDASRPLRPWVLGIAVNRCKTALAQRPRRPELVDHLHETAAAAPADDSAELAAEVRDALEGLRPDYRAAFAMFHEHGRSYEDIAAALGRPVGTVKTWLHRARLEILDRLRRRGMVPGDEHATDDPQTRRAGP